jgi:hypothetical protein
MGNPLSGNEFINTNMNSLNFIASPSVYNIPNPEQQMSSAQFISRPGVNFYPSIQKLPGNASYNTTTCVTLKEEMKRKINSINDHYDTYVPNFKY